MRYILIICALLGGCYGNSHEKPKSLSAKQTISVFYINEKLRDLDEKGQKIFDRLKNQKSTKNIVFYNVQACEGIAGPISPVRVNFELGGIKIDIDGCIHKVGEDSDRMITKSDEVYLAMDNVNGHIMGIISCNDRFYAVDSLGQWKVAIIELDQSIFKER